MTFPSQLNIVLIGPPGSGKGTQGQVLSQRRGLPFVSTGDMLRAAVKDRSPLGASVRAVMDAGGLVGDSLMIDLVRDRLERPDTAGGVILDGFPRTAVQALALEDLRPGRPALAVVLEVPDQELERRLDSRRICSTCKALSSSSSSYGSEAELCSFCGALLLKRDDDNLQTVRARLQTYKATATPLIAHYRERERLICVDGRQSAAAVGQAIETALALRVGL